VRQTGDNRYGSPHFATRQQRAEIYRFFNVMMKEACFEHGYEYIGICSRTVDSVGLIALEFAEDKEFIHKQSRHNIYLDKETVSFVVEFIQIEYQGQI